MLLLTRRAGQQIYIGDNIVVTIVSVRHGDVRIGIEAPREIPIERDNMGGRNPTTARPA